MIAARETASAERFAQRVTDLALAETALRGARATLRQDGRLVELKARQEALKARSAADAAVSAASVALDATRRRVDELYVRVKAGDETVTGAEVAAAEKDVSLAETRLEVVELDARQVRRSTEGQVRDNHLAELGADVIETQTMVPVIVRSVPGNAPGLSPMIVVSQTSDTKGYGTLDASGEVGLLVIGEHELNWVKLRQAFTEAGCDVQVSETGISFQRAAWPLPRLAAPSSLAVDRFARRMVRMWVEQIEQNERRARLAELGYNVAMVEDVSALAHIEGVSLTAEDGTATGTAHIRLGVEYLGAGTQVSSDDLIHDAREVVEALSRECVGEVTPAGQIASVELFAAERSAGDVWDVPALYGATGHALWPATITAEVRLTFAYEPASGHEIAED